MIVIKKPALLLSLLVMVIATMVIFNRLKYDPMDNNYRDMLFESYDDASCGISVNQTGKDEFRIMNNMDERAILWFSTEHENSFIRYFYEGELSIMHAIQDGSNISPDSFRTPFSDFYKILPQGSEFTVRFINYGDCKPSQLRRTIHIITESEIIDNRYGSSQTIDLMQKLETYKEDSIIMIQ